LQRCRLQIGRVDELDSRVGLQLRQALRIFCR
jgi:hypothetical protein